MELIYRRAAFREREREKRNNNNKKKKRFCICTHMDGACSLCFGFLYRRLAGVDESLIRKSCLRPHADGVNKCYI